jgi:hypothetical protein
MLQSNQKFDVYGGHSENSETESEKLVVTRSQVEEQNKAETYFKFKDLLGEEF